MAELVVGDDAALHRVQQAVALFEPGDDALDRAGEVGHADRIGVAPGGEQGRLVDQIGEVGAGEAGSKRGDLLRRHIGREGRLFQVHREDRFAASLVGPIDQDLAVEPAGAQQCRIENLRPVGRGEQHEAAGRVEAVELGQ